MEKYILFDSEGYVQPDFYDSVPAAFAKCRESFRKGAYNCVDFFVVVRITDSAPVKCFSYNRYQFFHGLMPTSYE